MSLIANRYQLGEVIGTGGMSNVYAADDVLLGRDVAIKMLKLDMARDDNFRERFRREAQNSAKLNHPCIVAVFDTGETDVDGVSVPYIVMERIYGRTLRDIVREDGPLTPEQAAELLIPTCDALRASHDAGIIHRDIKPANIMVTNTGSVKVMDFGIARALDDATSAMTQTSAVIGTAQYLSPEQARGKQADARSDVYALGCVLYEAVTGTIPFDGESPFAIAYQHVQEEPEAPSTRVTEFDLSPTEAVNIDAVVLTAMAKHPADRYQSATEMKEDLRRLQRGAVTQAARAHVTPSASESPTVVSPPVAATVTAAAPPTAATQQPAAPTPGRRRKDDNTLPKVLSAILAGLVLIAGGLFVWQNLFAGNGNGSGDDPQQAQPAAEPDMIAVPDVTGLPRDEAVDQLTELGLEVEEEEQPSPDVRADHVVRISPSPGSELREGTTVRLVVSTGEELTRVPDLSGLTPGQARDQLAAVGLTLNPEVEETSSDTVKEGAIVTQSPDPDTEISEGSAITVTVSTGPEMARVPSLTGTTWEDAEETLSSLGFVPTAEFVDSYEPENQVLSVGGAGSEARVGTEIIVRVSKGNLVDMPDVTRMLPDDAFNALRDAGWKGDRSKFRISDTRPATGALVDEGLVAGTEPSAGDTLRNDDPVTVYVWEFDIAELSPFEKP